MRRSITSIALLALAASAAPPDKRDTRPSTTLNKKISIVKDGVVNIEALKSHLAFIQG
jgi:hypothetical protein